MREWVQIGEVPIEDWEDRSRGFSAVVVILLKAKMWMGEPDFDAFLLRAEPRIWKERGVVSIGMEIYPGEFPDLRTKEPVQARLEDMESGYEETFRRVH